MLTDEEVEGALWILESVRPGAPLVHSTIHGERHWQAVARIGLRLVAETPGAQLRLALLFAILHDCRRENDDHDPDHGRRAASLLDELNATHSLGLSGPGITRLRAAVALHNDGEISRDPTIGVCWDADRLCLPRVGIVPDPALLSTRAGQERVGWARAVLEEPLGRWRAIVTDGFASNPEGGEHLR